MKTFRTILILLVLAAALGAVVFMLLPQGLDLHLTDRSAPDVPTLEACAVSHDHEFGAVYINQSIEDFNALGFAYGDSVDVTFSNGYTLQDLPYYNGYYTQIGEPLLVAYPGYPYIKAAINNGDCLWDVAKMNEGDTATITLRERGKYLDLQTARDIHYEDDRALFESDEVFANFRAVDVSGLQPNRLYRSASPCDNQHNRAPYADRLMGEAGVALILDLADDSEKIEGYLEDPDFASPNFAALYDAGKVVPIALDMNFSSVVFREKLVSGLIPMSEQAGPYLVHCTEGKDRTGFVCMVLEALCGATYQEIVNDYMITYANYYGIRPVSDAMRYDTIVHTVLDPMIRSMIGDDAADLSTADLAAAAEAFLKSGGMDDAQITALRDHLTAA